MLGETVDKKLELRKPSPSQLPNQIFHHPDKKRNIAQLCASPPPLAGTKSQPLPKIIIITAIFILIKIRNPIPLVPAAQPLRKSSQSRMQLGSTQGAKKYQKYLNYFQIFEKLQLGSTRGAKKYLKYLKYLKIFEILQLGFPHGVKKLD